MLYVETKTLNFIICLTFPNRLLLPYVLQANDRSRVDVADYAVNISRHILGRLFQPNRESPCREATRAKSV